MLVYNITFHIDEDIFQACLKFLKSEYIPQVTNSGFMHSQRMHRVLPYQEEADAQSYAVQFRVKNLDTLNYWIENEGLRISKQLADRFGQKVVGFATVLEEIDL